MAARLRAVWVRADVVRGDSARHRIVRTFLTSLVTIAAATGAGILVARALGPEGRGHYAAIMAWFGVSLVVGEFGQSASVTYHVARWPARAAAQLASARTLMVLTGSAVAMAGILASGFLGDGQREVVWAYRITFVGSLINSVFAPYVYAMQAVSIRSWNWIRAVQPLAYIILVGALYAAGQLFLVPLAAVLIVSVTVQGMVAAAVCLRRGLSGGRVNRKDLASLTRYGAAQSVSSVPAAFNSQIDKLTLSRVADPAGLGQYAVASSVVALGAPIASAIGSVVFPWLSRSDVASRSRRVVERKSIVVTMVGLTLSGATLAALGPWLIPVVFGADFSDAALLVWWLIPFVVFKFTSGVVGDLLRARGRPGLVAVAEWSGVAVTAVVIALLIPVLGLVGAAVAAAAGQAVTLCLALAAIWRVRAHEHERFHARDIPVDPSGGSAS